MSGAFERLIQRIETSLKVTQGMDTRVTLDRDAAEALVELLKLVRGQHMTDREYEQHCAEQLHALKLEMAKQGLQLSYTVTYAEPRISVSAAPSASDASSRGA